MTHFIVSFSTLFFGVWVFSFFKNPTAEAPTSNMPMCYQVNNLNNKGLIQPVTQFTTATSVFFDSDTAKTYAMPLLATSPNGDIILSWTERNDQGMISFCMATSSDKGQSFSAPKIIYTGAGVGNSRLFRAKVLAKKGGTLVALFSNRPDAKPVAGPPGRGGRGGGRSSELVFAESKDGGNTWSSPLAVDTDPTKGLLRGFFDAVVLPNDEIAIAYLKDVKGSTKHEERDLRLVLSKNGVFQPEKLIDAVVCDCCNINMLVDAAGNLHVYYRDNNDDIRDIARLTSSDNGETFKNSQIVHPDGWKIMGCPHSGATSVPMGKSALIAWFSGTESEPGLRLATQEGKQLLVVSEPSAKNHALLANADEAMMLWEQNQTGSEMTQVVYRTVKGDQVSVPVGINNTQDATNVTGLLINHQVIMAHEVKRPNKKNGLAVSTVKI